jgi:hypothetical protein
MFKRIRNNKLLKYLTISLILLFALNGFVLTFAFIGIKLHLFNDPGAVDYNDRYFQKMDEGYDNLQSDTTKNEVARIARFYSKLFVVNEYYPVNAQLIHKAFLQHNNIALAERMIEAINLNMIDSTNYNNNMQESGSFFKNSTITNHSSGNIFEWMNIPEWSDFKLAVVKDTVLIDSAAELTGVKPRLIVSVLLGEQMRLFNSTREVYKKVLSPLKILSVENNFSLGVTGVKQETAILAEKYLKDSVSLFYPGKKYEHLLDFYTTDVTKERFDRLVNYRNHFYSYLYAGVILSEVRQQWKKSGFDISDRPEILATLFNVGYRYSIPKLNPSVGGSTIAIKEKKYSFGALAFEFYYSGEMVDVFPYKPNYQ